MRSRYPCAPCSPVSLSPPPASFRAVFSLRDPGSRSMGDTAQDPVDHHRTTQPLAGETMKNTAKTPGLFLVAAGVVAFVFALASIAFARIGVGVGALVVALLAAGAGTAG